VNFKKTVLIFSDKIIYNKNALTDDTPGVQIVPYYNQGHIVLNTVCTWRTYNRFCVILVSHTCTYVLTFTMNSNLSLAQTTRSPQDDRFFQTRRARSTHVTSPFGTGAGSQTSMRCRTRSSAGTHTCTFDEPFSGGSRIWP